MRLVELDPRWLLVDGNRIGFAFRSPTKPSMWQSCFVNPPKISEQMDIFEAQVGEREIVQPCNQDAHWTCTPALNQADFETITVTPSLDGSAGGLWHGFIQNGQIVGGI